MRPLVSEAETQDEVRQRAAEQELQSPGNEKWPRKQSGSGRFIGSSKQ